MKILIILLLLTSPAFALTVIALPTGNFTIIGNGGISESVSYQTIRNNYEIFKSEYWMDAYNGAREGSKVWRRQYGNRGYFREGYMY